MGYSELRKLLKNARRLAFGANNSRLGGVISDAENAAFELHKENLELKEKIKKLESEKQLEETKILKHGVYFKEGDEENAYCSHCFDSENKEIALEKDAYIGTETFSFICPNCKKEFPSDIKHSIELDN